MNEFNKNSGFYNHKGEEKNYTHHETMEKIRRLAMIANEKEFFHLHQIRIEYESLHQATDQSRIKGSIHYAQGIRQGLPHANYEKILSDQEKYDQVKRRKYIEKAKSFYSEKVGISKDFNQKANEKSDKESTMLPKSKAQLEKEKVPENYQSHIQKLDTYAQIAGEEKGAYYQSLKENYIKQVEKWNESQKDLKSKNISAEEVTPPLVFQPIPQEPASVKVSRETGELLAKDHYHNNHSLTKEMNKQGRDYEHHQLLSQIDRYMSIAGKENSSYLQDLKEDYERAYVGWKSKYKQEDMNYTVGIKNGAPDLLHTDKQASREESERKKRHEVAMKAKDNYHQNFSLTSKFNEEAKSPPLSKNKDNEKGIEK